MFSVAMPEVFVSEIVPEIVSEAIELVVSVTLLPSGSIVNINVHKMCGTGLLVPFRGSTDVHDHLVVR